MEETWMDVVFSVELAGSVPVVYRDGARGIVFETTNAGTMAVVHYAYPVTSAVDGSPFTQAVADLRPDLDNSQGMGHAIRCYLSKAIVLDTMVTPERDGKLSLPDHLADELIRFSLLPKGLAGIICSHLLGQTTDADRLELASLLA